MLESKDKDQLLAIAQALGIKTNARAAKATLIDKILETTGSGSGSGSAVPAESAAPLAAVAPAPVAAPSTVVPEVVLGPDGEPLADWEIELLRKGELESPPPPTPAGAAKQQQRPKPAAKPATA